MFQSIKFLTILFWILTSSLYANKITPNEVYSEVSLISKELHSIMAYYNIKHNDAEIKRNTKITVNLKPRNVWQKSYEIMIKINILRNRHNLPTIKPVSMSPVLQLNPDLVYEQTQRILTELKVFKFRMGIPQKSFKAKKYKGMTPCF